MSEIIEMRVKKAQKLIEDGLHHFSNGEIAEATECFEESCKLNETAEAYTYIGWMLSFTGQLEGAIELCHKAISVDPEFGNPYNDIGTYYMKMGQLESAIPWLEKAKDAKRYEPKHYPYLNLGRIYLSQCMFLKALKEFEVALQFDPENTELRTVVARIREKHN